MTFLNTLHSEPFVINGEIPLWLIFSYQNSEGREKDLVRRCIGDAARFWARFWAKPPKKKSVKMSVTKKKVANIMK